jgi:N-carbamoylputrescine amidase
MPKSLRLTLAQMAVTENLAVNQQKGLDWVKQAANEGAQIICFTELGLLPFFPQYRAEKKFFQWAEAIDGPTVKKFVEAAASENIHILLNIFERAGAGEYYDATVLLPATGGATRPGADGAHRRRARLQREILLLVRQYPAASFRSQRHQNRRGNLL